MIRITKAEINALILNYFTQESFIYTSYVFKTECKEELKKIRKDLSLEKILLAGLQYLYGIDHYKDGKVNTCNVLYSIDRLHLCDVVLKKNNKTTHLNRTKDKLLKKTKELEVVATEIEKDNESEIEVQSTSVEEPQEINDALSLTQMSSEKIDLKFDSLSICKPSEMIAWNDEYLYIYSSTRLYRFKYGIFMDVKNINPISNIMYVDDILMTYDNSKLVIHNTFNLKTKSFLIKSVEILYDTNKFICVNLDGTINVYSTDGIKMPFSVTVFKDNAGATILDTNLIIMWSSQGEVAKVNVKTQIVYKYTQTSTSIVKACSAKNAVGYLLFADGTIGVYKGCDTSVTYIPPNATKFVNYGLCATNKYLMKWCDNLLYLYLDNTQTCVYKAEEVIFDLIRYNKYILLVCKRSLYLYDEELRLINKQVFENDIKKVYMKELDICVLFTDSSPILMHINTL